MAEINKISEALFEKIRDRFDDVSLGDEKAKATQNPEDARFFNFDYISEGNNYGNITISLIDDTSLKIYFSTNISDDLDDIEKNKWYSFLRELREFAKRNMLSFEPRDITRSTLKHRDIHQVSKSDKAFDKSDISLGESKLYGTAKQSYEKFGPARIVIKHSKPIVGETHGARARNINAIFVENDQGERFRLPFKNMTGARAMARHISAGGNTTDEFGKHITEMVSEYTKLRPFLRNVKTRTFEDTETQSMCEAAFEYHALLHNTLNKMKGKRGYTSYKESFVPSNTLMDDIDVDSFKDRFVKRVYNDKIDEALPIVNRAYKMKTSSKLAAQFESWANNVAEGTWATPNSDETTQQLIDLMQQPLTVGVDATNATGALYNILGDDELFNLLGDLANDNPEADARETVMHWLSDNDPELYQQVQDATQEDHTDTDQGEMEFERDRDEPVQDDGSEMQFDKDVDEAINWPVEQADKDHSSDNDLENDPHPYADDARLSARMRAKGYSDTEQGQMGTLDEAMGLHAHVKVIKGHYAGQTGYVRQVKTDRIRNKVYLDIDLEDGGQTVEPKENCRNIKPVTEADGEQTNSKLAAMVGKTVYVKTAGTSGTVSNVSPTHRNSLVIDLDNGHQTVAHFTDVSDEKPGTIRHVLDKFRAITGGSDSDSPARTVRPSIGRTNRDIGEGMEDADQWDGNDEPEDEICPVCNGSGEGQYDGTTCRSCKGSGIEKHHRDEDNYEPEDNWDEPDGYMGEATDEKLYPNDPPGYNKRVEELEAEGMDRSDAQGVADYEYEHNKGPWATPMAEASVYTESLNLLKKYISY